MSKWKSGRLLVFGLLLLSLFASACGASLGIKTGIRATFKEVHGFLTEEALKNIEEERQHAFRYGLDQGYRGVTGDAVSLDAAPPIEDGAKTFMSAPQLQNKLVVGTAFLGGYGTAGAFLLTVILSAFGVNEIEKRKGNT